PPSSASSSSSTVVGTATTTTTTTTTTSVPNLTRLPDVFLTTVRPALDAAPDPVAALGEAHLAVFDELKATVHGTAATADDAGADASGFWASLKGDPYNGERAWADDRCLLRYLRATKFHSARAARDRLAATLEWRRSYRPLDITAADIYPEAVTGKQHFTGFDRGGRPVLYLVPRLENTKTYERQLRYVVFNLECAIRLMPPGIEQVTIVVDFEDLNVFSAPPPGVSKGFLDIVANHYPERLARGIIVNPSWYLGFFFRVLGPFMDPATKAKVLFVTVDRKKIAQQQQQQQHQKAMRKKKDADGEDGGGADAVAGTGGWTTSLEEHVDPDQLPIEFGGTFQYKFDVDEYFKHISAVEVKA
ncbi:CRAL-TRIO domain-containing protein, partial [Zopfochytrium polystomum]